MTPRGFYIESITITGPDLPPASVTFIDGLNVVEGASDTGKSYLCSLIDFAFGSGTPPRKINASKGYNRVVARIKVRATQVSYEIERSLAGGDALIRTLDANSMALEQREAGAKHAAGDESTLSAFLLRASGFDVVNLRKNKTGETRTLSFRDVAFLVVVDETRIISEEAPHLSGQHIHKTVEGEAMRLLVTGTPPVLPLTAAKKTKPQAAKAQLGLVEALVTASETDLKALQIDPAIADSELVQLDLSWAETLKAYDTSRIELAALERERATLTRKLRDTESRREVTAGLAARFELLDSHYQNDVQRLDAIYEAGSMLDEVPGQVCPVCGAPAAAHRTAESAPHFQLASVRRAATAEREKTQVLREDLQHTLSELGNESVELQQGRAKLEGEIASLQARIESEAQSRMRATSEQLQAQAARRDLLLRGRFVIGQLKQLTARRDVLRAASASKGKAQTKQATGASTSEMDGLAARVEEVLKAWSFPELGRVVFSDETQDFVINGEDRKSHGKGVRALTCSAVIIALMRHCVSQLFPHPGLVVLDSPLVAYKPPDPGSDPDPDLPRLAAAGVKEAFYTSLAAGFSGGQVIVLENSAPPAATPSALLNHIHFSKARTVGRYGLFP